MDTGTYSQDSAEILVKDHLGLCCPHADPYHDNHVSPYQAKMLLGSSAWKVELLSMGDCTLILPETFPEIQNQIVDSLVHATHRQWCLICQHVAHSKLMFQKLCQVEDFVLHSNTE